MNNCAIHRMDLTCAVGHGGPDPGLRPLPVTAVTMVMPAPLDGGAILSIAVEDAYCREKPEAWNMRMVPGLSTVPGVIGAVAPFACFIWVTARFTSPARTSGH